MRSDLNSIIYGKSFKYLKVGRRFPGYNRYALEKKIYRPYNSTQKSKFFIKTITQCGWENIFSEPGET